MKTEFCKNFFFASLLMMMSCSPSISIDKLPHQKIAFNKLPDTVRQIYSSEIAVDTFRRVFKCVGCNKYSMIYHSKEDILDLAKHGFNYEFQIEGKKYILKANKGNPFIYDNGNFYYPDELNLDQNNYQQVFYNKVKLR